MALPRITLRDFTGGMNTSAIGAAIADNEGQACLNLFCDKRGRLRYVGGQHAVVSNLAGPVQGMRQFSSQTITRLLLGAAGQVYAYDSFAGGQDLIGTCAAAGNVEFAALYDKAFWVDGQSALQMWLGAGTARSVGITQPGAAPTAAVGAAGNLNATGTGSSPYQYYVVFKNTQTGVASNPSPIGNAVAPTNQMVNLSAVATSTDPQVNAREIYRVGGTSREARLVGTIFENTSTTFTDNVSDTALSLTQLVFNRDLPPVGMTTLYAHKNRIWGAKGYTLYFSSLGQPEYWPLTVKFKASDGGLFDVDPEANNPILGLCSTGSVLVVGRKKSIYIVLGDDHTNFALRKVAEIGIASHRSMVRCGNAVVFMSGDGMVYRLTDNEPQPIGLPIEDTLRGIEGVNLQNACAAYVDQRYILCVPRGAGLSPAAFAYDFRRGVWSDLSDASFAATQLLADPSAGVGGELFIATPAGYQDAQGQFFTGIRSVLSETDQTPLFVRYTTAAFDMAEPRRSKKARSIRVEGSVLLADETKPLMVTVRSLVGVVRKTRSFACKRSSGVLLERTLPLDLVGREISISVEGTILGGEINLIELEFAVVS